MTTVIQNSGFGSIYADGAIPTSPNGGGYGSGGGGTVIFRPEARVQEPNVYTTFLDAYNARQAIHGPAVIEFDDSIDTCYIYDNDGIPYDLEDTTLRGFKSLGNCGRVSVYVQDGVKFTNFREVRDLNLFSYSNSPIVTLENMTDGIRLTNAMLEDDSGGGWFNLVSSALALSMFQGASLSNDDGYVINVDGSSALFATLDDTNTNLGNATVGGEGTMLLYCGIDSQFQPQPISNFNASLAAEAIRLAYYPDNPGNWPSGSPSNAYDALNQLAARVYALENPLGIQNVVQKN